MKRVFVRCDQRDDFGQRTDALNLSDKLVLSEKADEERFADKTPILVPSPVRWKDAFLDRLGPSKSPHLTGRETGVGF